MSVQPGSDPTIPAVADDSSSGSAPETKDLIAELLVKSSRITADQLRLARRIQSKLPTPETLLRVLEDLRYVTRDQIQQALHENKEPIPLGALLLELGIIRDSELQSALALQNERPDAKLAQILVDHRLIDEKSLLEMFTLQLGFPRVSPASERLDPELMNRAPCR